ncbi:MAG: GTP 3',8-cyclase MoaA [Deltaproteobacteria bacterium]|nr:MAG: GTP 3',8-cyclase MoaA [Deltaproteobacteria bacterium]
MSAILPLDKPSPRLSTQPVEPLIDAHGRPIRSLRISLLDVCDLRCSYCMPAAGLRWLHPKARLSDDDVIFASTVASELGITRFRLTGGEPLLRSGLERLIARLRSEVDLDDLSLTTNGTRLEDKAAGLARAGLDRINISLDTLSPERFRALTRREGSEAVWRGILAAVHAGLHPVRVNVLLIADFNEDELDRWVELTTIHPITPRFLEVMPIGEAARGVEAPARADVAAARDALIARHGLVPVSPLIGNGPARYYKVPGAKGELGFITPLSDPYCNTCTRFRLTARGGVRPCLAQDHEHPLLDALRARDRAAVIAGLRAAAAAKNQGHRWREGEPTTTHMSTIGG